MPGRHPRGAEIAHRDADARHLTGAANVGDTSLSASGVTRISSKAFTGAMASFIDATSGSTTADFRRRSIGVMQVAYPLGLLELRESPG